MDRLRSIDLDTDEDFEILNAYAKIVLKENAHA